MSGTGDATRMLFVGANGEEIVANNNGTNLSGQYVFIPPPNAEPGECWEPGGVRAAVVDGSYIVSFGPNGVVQGHDIDKGPTHPCRFCCRFDVPTDGRTVWIFREGRCLGRLDLSGVGPFDDESEEGSER